MLSKLDHYIIMLKAVHRCLKKYHFYRMKFFCVIYIIIIFILFGCSRQNDNVLAVIGDRTITYADFIYRYKNIMQKMKLPDNGQVRKETFRNMIEEELLICEAIKKGYRDDPIGKYQTERIIIQELLNTYLKKKVFDHIKINEQELKDLYIRLHTKINACHLYADSKKQADSIYAELMNGNSFEEIAQNIFKDPQLRDTGGSLGYFTVDEMDPAFEDAAFSLKIGEISRPVRTALGYSIIRVNDRKTKPLLTETEYLKQRHKLKQYWNFRKRKIQTQVYVDSLRNLLNISFQEDVVAELYQYIKKRGLLHPEDEFYDLSYDKQIGGRELVRSDLGMWDVKTFNDYAKFTSETQLKWIRNEENLKDFIAGLVVRAYMLAQAENLELGKSDAFQKIVKQKKDEYLLKRMEEVISDGIHIPDSTLRTYYQKNKDQFITPEKIQLREIIVSDETRTLEIKNLLIKHASFEELAKKYSVHRRSAENDGDIGEFTYKDLGSHADRIFPLEIGKWIGPVKIDDKYAFFKCVNKYSKSFQTYDHVRSQVKEILKRSWQKEARQNLLKNIRNDIKMVTYQEKLTSIQIN
jgi:parvulin-like peptidyl-prolyl isomerase